MDKFTPDSFSFSRFTKTAATLMLGVGIVASLSGCVAVLVGGAMVGTAVVTSDRRTVASQAEDATIELKAVNRISTVFGKEVHVNVNSYNRTVLLTGEVKDEAAKVRVGDEIKAIENVRTVVNEIQVSAFLSGLGSRSSDALISAKVRSKLVATADIYSSSFEIVTENGVVYLMGRVSQREGETAAEAVREVSGVQKVVKVFEYINANDNKNNQAGFAEAGK